MPQAKTLKILGLLLALIAVGAGIGIFSARYFPPRHPAPGIDGMFWPDPKQLHDFYTVDDRGERFGLDRLQGKWSFLFFGYTHCPDVCPVTLAVMNQVREELQRQGQDGDVQMLFVTVDPERDSSERLADYLRQISPAILGLGGSMSQIQSLAGQIGVAAVKDEGGAHAGHEGYLVDHSTALFLIDPRGRLISLFSAPQTVPTVVDRFLKIRDFVRRRG